MDRLGEDCSAALFAAGAYSVASRAGMDSKDAGRFVSEVCKQAAAMRYDVDDDDEEQDTWWSRNKHWALPAALSASAFLIGADAGRNGRPDRSYLSNAGSLFLKRLKALFGISDSDVWRSVTETK